MRVSRSAVIYVAMWLGVVLVCSALGWWMISRAGEGVVTSEELPERSPSTSAPRGVGPAPTLSPSSTPPTSGSTRSTPVDGSTAVPVQRTWSGAAGVVVVECRGTAVGLLPSRPNDGFGVEVNDTGPGRVEVEFEGQGGSDVRTRVRAECVDGEPLFEVDSD